MEAYQRDFVSFLLDAGVLRFGEFTTKSGRATPYFIDTGRYGRGAQMERLAGFYARAIRERLGSAFDVLFGPAYKGIPLVVSTAMVLAREHGHDVGFAFNRKEAKDHGEGGTLVGHRMKDGERVLLVEDVTTAGTSVREVVPLLRRQADVRLAGLVVSVDRMERGRGEESALRELGLEFEMPVLSIVGIDDVIAHLSSEGVLAGETLERVREYRRRYGA